MTNVFVIGYTKVAASLAEKLGKKHTTSADGAADAVVEVSGDADLEALRGHGLVLHVAANGDAAFEEHYDMRVMKWDNEEDSVLVDRIVHRLNASKYFTSTRGAGGEGFDFLTVVRSGIASDGGLFMPQSLPTFTTTDFAYLAKQSYVATAQHVLEAFIQYQPGDATVTPQTLKELINKAYSTERWETPSICPVVNVESNVHVLELFHGPTAAFKDFALQLFPKFFTKSVAKEQAQYVILAATSGDTGVAAISGFMQEQGIAVLVLYPKGGVSAVQKAQMLACEGGNVRVLGVDADFDFCQTTVKMIFNDVEYKAELLKDANAVLSSANSINWGRLLPQIVYYIYGYSQLLGKNVIQEKDEVDVIVPTGNFGNILSAYIAKAAGLPVRRFICASNENNVLTDFITSGVYDIRERGLKLTASPSIDILKSSNVERFLFLLSEGDSGVVANLMSDLDTKGYFELPKDLLARLQRDFTAGFCTEAECLATIKSVQDRHNYLLDTHTAVAYKVMCDYKAKVGAEVPILLASTASFAKFPDAVKEGLDGKTAPSLAPYDVHAVYKDLLERTSATVPRALSAAVNAPPRDAPPRECEKSLDTVKALLKEFCLELKQ
eukprot:TRINITY_DN26509_c0_g1_i1.p1 TRINITY_DN26509_c0_g1~~TRINITY_DN26509_c0_g1_i1.p1  ORF type:complete len:622 (+),score=171.21 TRINITY_DN26509_c0_g1_i1:38-1867(+)